MGILVHRPGETRTLKLASEAADDHRLALKDPDKPNLWTKRISRPVGELIGRLVQRAIDPDKVRYSNQEYNYQHSWLAD